jgi:predicted dehydrogenase
MPVKVRVGLIGTSGWADELHLPVLASHNQAVLAAICGRNGPRARALADKYGVAQVFTDYRRMIEDAELDAVVVATPEDLHHPMVMAAVQAGLHVLCEKPLAFSAAQSAEMLAAVEQAGVKHMVQFTNRGLPHYRYLKRLLDDGYIGVPYHAYFTWPTGWGPAHDVNPYHWAYDAARAKGVANELGAHMIDVARWFLGDVVRVSASMQSFVHRDGPDGAPMENANDSALMLLDFANGAHAMVHVGSPNIAGPGLRHTGQTAIICGSDGTLETRADPWTVPPVSEITGLRRGSDQAENLVVPDAYYGGVDPIDRFGVFKRQSIGPRLFIDSIINDLPITPSFVDGHQVQRIIEAAIDSHLTGQARVLGNPDDTAPQPPTGSEP